MGHPLSSVAELSSSESITRHLRSKDSALDDIILTANELINTNSKVLPNLNIFLFELVVDKLNESKNPKFKNSKLDHRVWDLFVKIWNRFDESESKLKDSILRKLKLSEILKAFFDRNVDVSSMQSLMRTLQLITGSSFFQLQIEDSVFICNNYLDAIYQIEASQKEKEHWSKLILSIYDSSADNSSKIITKKFLNDYSVSVLPSALKILTSESINESTKQMIRNFIIGTLFSASAQLSLKSNIEQLVKELTEGEGPSSLTYLYTLILSEISDTATTQDIFIIITEKFPSLKAPLLKCLSTSNKTLPPDFLTLLIEKEVNIADSDSENLELIYHIISLDLGVGHAFAPQIFGLLEARSASDDTALQVSSKLIEAFIRARDFETFYTAWINMISLKDGLFRSQEFTSLVAKNLSYLSSFQLDAILKKVILPNVAKMALTQENSKYFITLIPMIDYATETKDKLKRDLLKKNFVQMLKLKIVYEESARDATELFWRLRYSLLSLFDESDFDNENELSKVCDNVVQDCALLSSSRVMHAYFCLFRIREIIRCDLESKTVSAFVKCLKDADPNLVKYSFTRWMVVFNRCFSEKEMKSVVKVFLNEKHALIWNHVFANEHIFEQTKLINEIISQLINILQEKKMVNTYLDAITTIPAQCYHRVPKIQMINLLTKDQSPHALSIAVNLLELPTFKTRVETDVDALFNLGKNDKMSNLLFTVIWKHHYNQCHDKLQQSWIASVILKLEIFYKSASVDTLSEEHYISASILKNSKAGAYPELSKNFQASVLSLLKSYAKSADSHVASISWIIDSINDLDLPCYGANLKETVILIGKTSDTLKPKLFILLTRIIDSGFEEAAYLATLYTVISEADDQVDNALKLYLGKLKLDDYLKVFELLSSSFKEIDTNATAYIRLLQEFIAALDSHKEKEDNRQLQSQLTSALSTLLSCNIVHEADALTIIHISKLVLSELGWSITQYSFELMISLGIKIAVWTRRARAAKDIYIAITQVFSIILLYQRHRLSGRHHLIMNFLTALLECLYYKKNEVSEIGSSPECGTAFERLISNLCEPGNIPQNGSTNQLNSASAVLKKDLRSSLPMLLINFISLQTRFNMESKTREKVLSGIYLLFDTLTQDELYEVNSSLNVTGKSYFKTLYEDYRKFGKWQDNV